MSKEQQPAQPLQDTAPLDKVIAAKIDEFREDGFCLRVARKLGMVRQNLPDWTIVRGVPSYVRALED